MLKALLVDHKDSFTYNIKAWLEPRFNICIIDYEKINQVILSDYDLIILSPGPKRPNDYPQTKNFLHSLPESKPVLGICLGFQIMNEIEEGLVSPYYPPIHGKTSPLDSPHPQFEKLMVARYHSLKCNMSDQFEVLASSESIPMMARHKQKNWLGFQFHPESFMTEKSDVYLQMVVDLCNP